MRDALSKGMTTTHRITTSTRTITVTLSDDAIARWRTEAGQAGDLSMARICERALAGSRRARREVARCEVRCAA